MKVKPPVVLLGTDCLTGLQTSRILWRRGVIGPNKEMRATKVLMHQAVPEALTRSGHAHR